MGSKQKRRIARAERLIKQAHDAKAMAEERLVVADQKLRDVTVERNRLRRLLQIDFAPDEQDRHLLGLRLYFDRRTFLMMRDDPAEVIAREVYEKIRSSDLLPRRDLSHARSVPTKGAPDEHRK